MVITINLQGTIKDDLETLGYRVNDVINEMELEYPNAKIVIR